VVGGRGRETVANSRSVREESESGAEGDGGGAGRAMRKERIKEDG